MTMFQYIMQSKSSHLSDRHKWLEYMGGMRCGAIQKKVQSAYKQGLEELR
jgi:hypothetical protein